MGFERTSKGALLVGILLAGSAGIGRAQCDPSQADNARTIAEHGNARGLHAFVTWTMIGIAACESGLDERARNPSGASGLFQFMPVTWRANRDRYFGGNQGDPFNPADNAATAAAIVAHSGFGPWDRPANSLPDPYLRWRYGEIAHLPCYCFRALRNAGYEFIAGTPPPGC